MEIGKQLKVNPVNNGALQYYQMLIKINIYMYQWEAKYH
jgi:hypothetical protein